MFNYGLECISKKHDDSDNNILEYNLFKSRLYNNLGNAYRRVNDHDNSFKYYSLCLKMGNLYTYSIACLNLGSMLIEKGDLLPGITYLEKVYSTGATEFIKYLTYKGMIYLFEHPNIKEAILDFYTNKHNNSILKLKNIYHKHEKNPIVNFFLAYNYIAMKKYEKSSLFFNKLMRLNDKYKYENNSFTKKIIYKARLVMNKITDLDSEINNSYIKELLDFEDFAYLSNVEYEDVYEDSIHNRMNTDINIILTGRTVRRSKYLFLISYS